MRAGVCEGTGARERVCALAAATVTAPAPARSLVDLVTPPSSPRLAPADSTAAAAELSDRLPGPQGVVAVMAALEASSAAPEAPSAMPEASSAAGLAARRRAAMAGLEALGTIKWEGGEAYVSV